jgi:hypothetical protein
MWPRQPVPAQMWGEAASPGADVGRGKPVPAQMWGEAAGSAADVGRGPSPARTAAVQVPSCSTCSSPTGGAPRCRPHIIAHYSPRTMLRGIRQRRSLGFHYRPCGPWQAGHRHPTAGGGGGVGVGGGGCLRAPYPCNTSTAFQGCTCAAAARRTRPPTRTITRRSRWSARYSHTWFAPNPAESPPSETLTLTRGKTRASSAGAHTPPPAAGRQGKGRRRLLPRCSA